MEESRIKVQKTSKILAIIIKVIRIFVMFSIVGMMIICVVSMFGSAEFIAEVKSTLQAESVFEIIEQFDLLFCFKFYHLGGYAFISRHCHSY